MSEPPKTSPKLQALIKQITYKQYAQGDPKRALRELMNEVELKVRHFRKECWNITIELLADYLGLLTNPWQYSDPDYKWTGPISKPSYPSFQQLKEQIQKTNLIEAYVEAAKAQPWDYLGEIFCEDELAGRNNRLGQMLTPKNVVDFMIELTGNYEQKPYSYAKPDIATLIWLTSEALEFNEALPLELLIERARRHTVLDLTPLLIKYEPKPITQLDPCTGTGRFLLEASILHPKAPLILFGIEIDLYLYRACLVNMAMFSKHPYSIICANTLMLDPNYPASIWNLGNQWDPPDMSPYYFKIEPPFKFSLAELAKEKTNQPTQPIAMLPTSPLLAYMKTQKTKS